MKNKFIILALFAISFIFVSCEKKETPYPLPEPGDALFAKVDIGDFYETQVFFSFTNGIVKVDSFTKWDLAFNTQEGQHEFWLNGGKNILVYPSGQSDFNFPLPTIGSKEWLYDEPNWKYGKSALGILKPELLDELIFLKLNKNHYKLKVIDANEQEYKIEFGQINDAVGTEIIIPKNQNYGYTYFSFEKGIIEIEPVKTEWDILFTRYRHIFYGENPDGSDMPYFVNGVLLNPYQTTAAADTLTEYDFNRFSLNEAEKFTLVPTRDIIGFNWKQVNINNGEYTVLPKRVYILNDQNDDLWKIHFVNFYDENGRRGKPQFEYKRLK